MDEIRLNRQQCRILAALRRPGGITAGEIKDELGIMDGRKRISEIKAKGFNVVSVWEEGHDRYGEPCRYKRYKVVS